LNATLPDLPDDLNDTLPECPDTSGSSISNSSSTPLPNLPSYHRQNSLEIPPPEDSPPSAMQPRTTYSIQQQPTGQTNTKTHTSSTPRMRKNDGKTNAPNSKIQTPRRFDRSQFHLEVCPRSYFHTCFINDTTFEVEKRYEVEEIVGQGAYGIVCSALDLKRNKKCAIKKISHIFDHRSLLKRTLREMKLLRCFHHENVLGLSVVTLFHTHTHSLSLFLSFFLSLSLYVLYQCISWF